METLVTRNRLKHRYVELPRQLDKKGEPIRMKVLEPARRADGHAAEAAAKLVRAVCPRGVPTDEIREALYADIGLKTDSSAFQQLQAGPVHTVGRTKTRSVHFIVLATSH